VYAFMGFGFNSKLPTYSKADALDSPSQKAERVRGRKRFFLV